VNYRFRPPRPNRLVIALVNTLLPLLLRARERVVRVVVEPDGWRLLRELRGRPALLVLNHPSETEPSVMTWLARALGEPFFYLATHEIFAGPVGWLVQRMGAFSVVRGRPDFAALRTAVNVLARQRRKLVVFPEGETHMQNDLVLPLKAGAVQIGFWARERGEAVSLPIVPLVIRYRYVGDALPALARGMARLERRLGLSAGATSDLAGWLRRAGLVVLDGVEREYGLTPPAGSDLDERVGAVTEYIVARVAHTLPMQARLPDRVKTLAGPDAPLPLRMRALFNAVFDYVDGLAEGKTFYERRLHRRRVAAARSCLADLWRMQNFLVITADALNPPAPPERLGEVLFRLEREVYGTARTRPWREARIVVGVPLDLADYQADHAASRKRTLARVTGEIETRLRALLAEQQPG